MKPGPLREWILPRIVYMDFSGLPMRKEFGHCALSKALIDRNTLPTSLSVVRNLPMGLSILSLRPVNGECANY